MLALLTPVFTLITLISFTVLANPTNPTTQNATPEIPAGAAPVIVAGIMGAVMFVRSRRNKNKKD